jgi:hypothetical protein
MALDQIGEILKEFDVESEELIEVRRDGRDELVRELCGFEPASQTNEGLHQPVGPATGVLRRAGAGGVSS